VGKYLSLILIGLSLGAQAKSPKFDENVKNTTLLNPECPLLLTGIYQDSARNKRNRVSVRFFNQSKERVIGIKVGFDGLDAVWDSHDISKTFALAVDLRPKHNDAPVWRVNDLDFEANTAGGIRVFILKIMFEDGSIWKDDGTQKCSLGVSGRPKAQRRDDD
jgi:hypothetical protein